MYRQRFSVSMAAACALAAGDWGTGAMAAGAPDDVTPEISKEASESQMAAAATATSGQTSAADADARQPIEEMEVFGRGLSQVGTAYSAGEGTVGYDDLSRRPILRIGELAESVPGLIATQHSGGGKANQYFLRGFNLDHGTDFSVSLDGVPENIRSHAHGQGYLDLNFMIPELVERIDYSKGAYRADTGDFSAAGSARFKTYDRLDQSFASAEVGSYDYERGVFGLSLDAGANSSLLVGGEVTHEDGPWVLDEDLERYKGFAKFTHDTGDVVTRLSLYGFSSNWRATDQVPQRAVANGLISRFGYIDPDSGGHTSRYGATASVDAGTLHLMAYAYRYTLNLFSDATYFQDDPVHGDAIEQADRRWVVGGSGRKDWTTTVADMPWDLRLGLDMRGDIADQVGLFHVADRERFFTVRDDDVQEYSFELWGEAEAHLTDRLRLTLGLRESYFTGTVDSRLAANSGSADAWLLQPKATLAWEVIDGVELYASAGEGFHSNSAQGATTHVDPASGDPADPAPFLVKAKEAEAGARFELIDGMKATVSAFLLDLDSELIFVGDAGTSEPSDGTRRYGVEGTVFWTMNEWLTFDVETALTHARFTGAPGVDHIPQSIPFMLAAGAMFDFHPVHMAWRLRHFSSTPLIEDNSVRSDPTTVVNGSLSYELGPVTATLSVFNVFDAKDPDIQYYFSSRLKSEPAPVDDIMLHPSEPREFRFSVTASF